MGQPLNSGLPGPGQRSVPVPAWGLARNRLSYRLQTKLLPYLLVAPLALFIGVLAIYPTVLTTIRAFYGETATNPIPRFVGVQNFVDLFKDSQVTTAWINTAWYVIFGVIVSTLLGIVIALLLRHSFLGRGLLLALMILPWALPGVVEGVIWKWIYDPTFGVLNSVLTSLHIIQDYQLWIGKSQVTTIFLIELSQIWQITPLSALIILATLQQIPTDVYEAAAVDGSSTWSTLRWITLPLIRAGIAVAAVQAIVLTLNVFDQVYVLNGSAPVASSIMSQTYFIAFQELNFGKGYALSLLATVATAALSLLVLRFLYRQVEY